MEQLKNIKTPQELLDFMELIEYKWMDKKGNIHSSLTNEMYTNYSFMTPEEVFVNKCGICGDQCNFEKFWFLNNGYKCKIMEIGLIRENEAPGHFFLIYKDKDKYIWFENAWNDERGIHEYDSYELLIKDIRNKFILQNAVKDNELQNIIIAEQKEYPYHISFEEMDKIDNCNKTK